MVDVEPLPNVEVLAIAYLLTLAPVTAIVEDRVSSDLPSSTTFPYLQVIVYDDDPRSTPLHFVEFKLQISAYANAKVVAHDLAAAARAGLHNAPNVDHDLARVTSTRTRGWGYRPDTSYTPAKPRYTFDASLFIHPLREGP